MQQKSLDNGAVGCLKTMALNVLAVIFGCGLWYLYLGPRGILIGIAGVFVYFSAILFVRVFGRTEEKHQNIPPS